jgi:hypothetical protein
VLRDAEGEVIKSETVGEPLTIPLGEDGKPLLRDGDILGEG